ncbi:MAG: DUF302 domain-containing protein [Alphaproteobacteria bacterium]|nr:DUF302 domain-containing protein [Alphaproteobacteria bacterium]MCW5741551.1 DUF302 domain-containing protein [Alphaproteobacteria bacterium]
MKMHALILAGFLGLLAGTAAAREPNEMFLMRTSTKAPDQIVAAVRSYVLERKWLYLAAFKLKGGEIDAVKICYPPIGKDIFAAGLHVAAMMPCGHIAIYREGDATRISMLHPNFMHALYPDPNLEKAAKEVTPLFEAMLDAIVR